MELRILHRPVARVEELCLISKDSNVLVCGPLKKGEIVPIYLLEVFKNESKWTKVIIIIIIIIIINEND